MTNFKASGSSPIAEVVESRLDRSASVRRQPVLRLVPPEPVVDRPPVPVAPKLDLASVHLSAEVAIPRSRASLRSIVVGADLTAVVAGLAVTTAVLGQPSPSWAGSVGAAGIVGLGMAWMIAFSVHRLYLARYVESIVEETKRVMTAGAMVLAGALIAFYLAGISAPTREWTVLAFVFVSSLVLAERAIARAAFRRLRANGHLRRRIAIVGTDEAALALCEALSRDPSLGYDVVGLIGSSEVDPEFPTLADIDHAPSALAAHGCVGVIVSIPSLPAAEVNRAVRELNEANLHVVLSTTVTDIDLTRLRPQGIDGHVMLYVEPAVRSGWRATAKRTFDIVVAGLLLLVTLPLSAVAAAAVRLTSPGPILFRQIRVGRDGEVFEMLKFRTMVADAEAQKQALLVHNEADGPLFKMAEDPRVTRPGRLLRRCSIDELPQLWNVLRGEMSMVGPRPALPEEVDEWDPDLRRRLTVPPGITGEWQVSGRSDTSFAEYRRLDLYYVDNWTLGHDAGVCLKTAWAVVRADGAK